MPQEMLYLPPPFPLPFPPPLPLPLPLLVASPSHLPFALPLALAFVFALALAFVFAFACALPAIQHVVERAYVRASGCVVELAMGCGVGVAERVAVWCDGARRA